MKHTSDSIELLLIEKVSQSLDVPCENISKSTHLLDAGFDSMRLVTLMEELWEEGIQVEFETLAQFYTIDDWKNSLVNQGLILPSEKGDRS